MRMFYFLLSTFFACAVLGLSAPKALAAEAPSYAFPSSGGSGTISSGTSTYTVRYTGTTTLGPGSLADDGAGLVRCINAAAATDGTEFNLVGSNAGAATNHAGYTGGSFLLAAGAASAGNGTNKNGGAGGQMGLTSTAGAAGTGTGTGGAGGAFAITAGAGGDSAGGTGTAGNGGSIFMQPGAPGAANGGTPGTFGAVGVKGAASQDYTVPPFYIANSAGTKFLQFAYNFNGASNFGGIIYLTGATPNAANTNYEFASDGANLSINAHDAGAIVFRLSGSSKWSIDSAYGDFRAVGGTSFHEISDGVMTIFNSTETLGDYQPKGSLLTDGTPTPSANALVRQACTTIPITNAQVAALAGTAADLTVITLPAKTVLINAYIKTTAATFGDTLTISLGRTGANYIDYIVASDAKATATYGDGAAERGTNLTGYDLSSLSGTTALKCHFDGNATNLSTVTGFAATVYLVTETLP